MNKLDWRNLSSDELESNFNPRIAVPDFASYLEEAQKKASEARKYIPGKIDISLEAILYKNLMRSIKIN